MPPTSNVLPRAPSRTHAERGLLLSRGSIPIQPLLRSLISGSTHSSRHSYVDSRLFSMGELARSPTYFGWRSVVPSSPRMLERLAQETCRTVPDDAFDELERIEG